MCRKRRTTAACTCSISSSHGFQLTLQAPEPAKMILIRSAHSHGTKRRFPQNRNLGWCSDHVGGIWSLAGKNQQHRSPIIHFNRSEGYEARTARSGGIVVLDIADTLAGRPADDAFGRLSQHTAEALMTRTLGRYCLSSEAPYRRILKSARDA